MSRTSAVVLVEGLLLRLPLGAPAFFQVKLRLLLRAKATVAGAV